MIAQFTQTDLSGEADNYEYISDAESRNAAKSYSCCKMTHGFVANLSKVRPQHFVEYFLIASYLQCLS